MTQTVESPATMTGRALDEWLHRIRALHIEVEAILQSLAAALDDNPCARCTRVCCREVFCRESVESDFLKFVLGPRVEAYDENAGWFMPGAGCRLSYGRPLLCYEYFCEKFDAQAVDTIRQLSRALKTLYANALAGQHILVVDDIRRIGARKLRILHDRLEGLRDRANAALRQSLDARLCGKSAGGAVGDPRGAA